MKHDPIHDAGPARAFVLFRSGRRLDLLNPRSDGWTDEDLAPQSGAHQPMGRGDEMARIPLGRSAQPARPANPRDRGGSDAARGAQGIASRRIGGIARLGTRSVRLKTISASLSASSSIGCRPWSASATPCRRGTPPPIAGTRRPIVSPRPLKPHTSSAGAAKICAMRSESSASPSRTDPLPMPGLEPWEPWPPRLAKSMFLHRLLDLQATAELHESDKP